jgi:hypothetical protein
LASCQQYTTKDPSVGTNYQLFDATGTTLVGCTESSITFCPSPYRLYFAKAGFNAKAVACQASLPTGKSCVDLYSGKYSQPVIADGVLQGCIEPCNPVTEYMLYEMRYGVPELAECGTKTPNSCNAKYGVDNYIYLQDGTDQQGGNMIGCLQFDTSKGEAGADQECPDGFGFALYGPPTIAISRVPVLRQCWKGNGGNADW